MTLFLERLLFTAFLTALMCGAAAVTWGLWWMTMAGVALS